MKNFVALLPFVTCFAVVAAPITLPGGHHIETDLAEAKVIAVLTLPSNGRYILIAGRDCIECDENTSLYVGKLNGTKLAYRLADKRNVYPGTLRDYESGDIVQRARVFFGHCVFSSNKQIIWFVEYLTSHGKWVKGEYLTILNKDGPRNTSIKDKQPDIKQVLSAVKSGTCHEVPGIDGTTEP